jgi:hypothetical protein
MLGTKGEVFSTRPTNTSVGSRVAAPLINLCSGQPHVLATLLPSKVPLNTH